MSKRQKDRIAYSIHAGSPDVALWLLSEAFSWTNRTTAIIRTQLIQRKLKEEKVKNEA